MNYSDHDTGIRPTETIRTLTATEITAVIGGIVGTGTGINSDNTFNDTQSGIDVAGTGTGKA